MPSKKGIEQALTWLKSKAADKNTLDSVNAELCINVIMDLQRQYDRLGAQFSHLQNRRKPGEAPAMREEQMSFLKDDIPETEEKKEEKPAIPHAERQRQKIRDYERTKNIPLNEKGDAHNDKTGKGFTGVYRRESDR